MTMPVEFMYIPYKAKTSKNTPLYCQDTNESSSQLRQTHHALGVTGLSILIIAFRTHFILFMLESQNKIWLTQL